MTKKQKDNKTNISNAPEQALNTNSHPAKIKTISRIPNVKSARAWIKQQDLWISRCQSLAGLEYIKIYNEAEKILHRNHYKNNRIKMPWKNMATTTKNTHWKKKVKMLWNFEIWPIKMILTIINNTHNNKIPINSFNNLLIKTKHTHIKWPTKTL